MPDLAPINSRLARLPGLAALAGLRGPGVAWVWQTDLARALRRGWRYIAVGVAIALTVAALYLARTKRLYQASTRILVLQQNGTPLSSGESRLMGGTDDYIPTHAIVLKSPLVVGRAIEAVGPEGLPTLAEASARSGKSPVVEAIARLVVSRPDRTAKILNLDYQAGSREEATTLVEAIVESYEKFLEDKYQKNNGEMVRLISAARDNLSKELAEMEVKYLAFRKDHPMSTVDDTGRSFMSRRLDQWDRARNEAMVKEVQLKMQLELGRSLAAQGVGFWAIAHALNQVGSSDPNGGLMAHATEASLGSADYVRALGREQQELAERNGAASTKVRAIQDQITSIQERSREAKGKIDAADVRDLLASLEGGLKTVETMRAALNTSFDRDLQRAKEDENDLLTEANLKGNLDQYRTLFNTIVEQLKRAQLVGDYASVSAQVIEPPNALTSPVSPRLSLTLALALVGGCGLGAVAAYLADRLDPRVRTVEEMREALGLPLIGRVPQLVGAEATHVGLIAHTTPFSPTAEAYRAVRTNIELHRRSRRVGVILVTSPYAGDGKTTSASNLAISMAHSGRRVLLIDADLRSPSQHKVHGLPRGRGLAQVLRNELPAHAAVARTAVPGLDLIPAGAETPNPAELLMSPRVGEILDAFGQSYDTIIVDSPPLLAVTDAAILSAVADGIVLVSRVSSLHRRDAERAGEQLRSLGTPILGVLANGLDRDQGGYGYGYGYTGTPAEVAGALAEDAIIVGAGAPGGVADHNANGHAAEGRELVE